MTLRGVRRFLARRVPDTVMLHYLFWRRGFGVGRFRRPRTFSEHVQHRKLHDRDPRHSALADKIGAKEFVRGRLGEDWIIPTLWSGDRLPQCPPRWPAPYVLKAAHGSDWNWFVRTAEGEDWAAMQAAAARWLREPFGISGREHHYRAIPRRLLVEPMLGDPRASLTDYKFFVFGGKVAFLHMDADRGTQTRRVCLDRDWRVLPFRLGGYPEADAGEPPARFGDMLAAAEALGSGFDFVRVDLYDVDGAPKFGELTFTPEAGFGPFRPSSIDAEMGRRWAEARTVASTSGRVTAG